MLHYDDDYIKGRIFNLGLGTAISGTRLSVLWAMAIIHANDKADIAEVGVYRGGSAFTISEALFQAGSHSTFYMVDTFEGIPFIDVPDGEFHVVGDFKDVDYLKIKQVLENMRGENIIFKGLFKPDFIKDKDNLVFSFVHIDVDVYRSVLDCLIYFWPRMIRGGHIILDDPYMQSCPGARVALDEFCRKENINYVVLPTVQVLLTKLER